MLIQPHHACSQRCKINPRAPHSQPPCLRFFDSKVNSWNAIKHDCYLPSMHMIFIWSQTPHTESPWNIHTGWNVVEWSASVAHRNLNEHFRNAFGWSKGSAVLITWHVTKQILTPFSKRKASISHIIQTIWSLQLVYLSIRLVNIVAPIADCSLPKLKDAWHMWSIMHTFCSILLMTLSHLPHVCPPRVTSSISQSLNHTSEVSVKLRLCKNTWKHISRTQTCARLIHDTEYVILPQFLPRQTSAKNTPAQVVLNCSYVHALRMRRSQA